MAITTLSSSIFMSSFFDKLPEPDTSHTDKAIQELTLLSSIFTEYVENNAFKNYSFDDYIYYKAQQKVKSEWGLEILQKKFQE